jgi:hypothetical protein
MSAPVRSTLTAPWPRTRKLGNELFVVAEDRRVEERHTAEVDFDSRRRPARNRARRRQAQAFGGVDSTARCSEVRPESLIDFGP